MFGAVERESLVKSSKPYHEDQITYLRRDLARLRHRWVDAHQTLTLAHLTDIEAITNGC